LKKRIVLSILSVVLVISLSGCFDLISIPNTATSSDGEWVALLQMSDDGENLNLVAINLNNDSQVEIGATDDNQGAFDWHPSRPEIAYYNVSFDDIPSIKISNVNEDPAGVNALGAFAFPSDFWVTQLAYSPDGNQLAMSVILLPAPITDLDQMMEESPDVQFDAAMYIADLTQGEVTAVTEPGQLFPSTLDWSPDGSKLAFNAWSDGNEDGIIDVSGFGIMDTMFGGGADVPDVYVYDLAAGSTTNIGDGSFNLSPDWVSNNEVAYVYQNIDIMTETFASGINLYEVDSGNVRPLQEAPEGKSIGTLSASPDGSQIAYTVSPSESLTSELDLGFEMDGEGANAEASDETEATPWEVMVMNIDQSASYLVYETTSLAAAMDVPVWTADGNSLLLSSANALSSLTSTVEMAPEESGLAPQQVILVDVSDPENPTSRVVFEGPMSSSGLLQFVVSLTGMTGMLGELEGMEMEGEME